MISSDMSEYFSDKDRVTLLENILDAQARIKELEVELSDEKTKATYSKEQKEYYKRLYIILKKEKRPSPSQLALKMISELRGTGDRVSLINEIAEKCFLSKNTISSLWYKKNDSLVRGNL